MNNHSRPRTWRWLVIAIVGGAIGTIVGAIVAVNIVIYSGLESGYETSLPEVYRQLPVIGVVVTVVLIAGPVVGVLIARRIARSRSEP